MLRGVDHFPEFIEWSVRVSALFLSNRK